MLRSLREARRGSDGIWMETEPTGDWLWLGDRIARMRAWLRSRRG